MSYLIIAGCLAMSGCAAMFNGRKQEVPISSTPLGVTVKTAHGESCTTPCVLELRRKKANVLVFEKDGYDTQSFVMEKTISPPILADFLFFWPGLLVSLPMGSQWDLKPKSVNVTMAEVTAKAE